MKLDSSHIQCGRVHSVYNGLSKAYIALDKRGIKINIISFLHKTIRNTVQRASNEYTQYTVDLKTKGLSEILRDIHTLTYQICRIEGKNKSTTFHK